ncbi:MAG: hypothetical protein ACREEK_34120 [Bradyrhizobium sp.]
MKFRVELVWQGQGEDASSSIYLTSDGRVVLQGKPISQEKRMELSLPTDATMITVDQHLIRAIKEML